MNKLAKKLAVLAGAGVSAGIAHRARSRGQANGEKDGARWLPVTVYRPIGDVEGHLPTPITDLGDMVEVRVRPAPGDRGTEIAAKLKDGSHSDSGFLKRLAGRDPNQEVRRALREAKSLLEAGEVVQADIPSTHPGLRGKVLELATERADGEGRL
jgi:hypothetical protein